jgi:hypothetical protein
MRTETRRPTKRYISLPAIDKRVPLGAYVAAVLAEPA